jgi:potassium uptake TrkH family protein
VSRLRREGVRLKHPAQFVVLGFAAVILIGALLLSLPIAANDGQRTDGVTALFTATSAVCVTGLVVVDTGTYWSGFGEGVILALIQVGGFGIITAGSVFVLAMSHRLGLRSRLLTQSESGALSTGDVRVLVKHIAKVTVALEGVGALVLSLRFWQGYDQAAGDAVYLGVFHSVSAFNNAGFSPFSDSLIGFVSDPLITLTISVLVILGGTGFPVLLDLQRRDHRPHQWSVHTKLTLMTTGVLLVVGTAALAWFEWSNAATMGSLDVPGKMLAAFFQSVNPRTAGFNSVDTGALTDPGLLLTNVLMIIGGGSAGTAGGMKVTTFALLGFVMWAELRGEPDVNVFRRRVPTSTQRQAVTIALLGIGAVVMGSLALGVLSEHDLSATLFEAVSALGTVGLSTGITPTLAAPAQLVLVALMFLGRLGPATFGTALVLRAHDRAYRFPEERPIIG